MCHLQSDVNRLGEEMHETRRELREDMNNLRHDNERGFDNLRVVLADQLKSLGDRMDNKIASLAEHMETCSKTNGTRLKHLEEDNLHAKGVTKGVMAVVALLCTVLGGLITAVARMFAQ